MTSKQNVMAKYPTAHVVKLPNGTPRTPWHTHGIRYDGQPEGKYLATGLDSADAWRHAEVYYGIKPRPFVRERAGWPMADRETLARRTWMEAAGEEGRRAYWEVVRS